jgi:predicted nucleic acid-binding protein
MIPEKARKRCLWVQVLIALIAKLIQDRMKFKIKDRNFTRLMQDFNIDEGDMETLMLAIQEKRSVATDDKNAINACKIMKLSSQRLLAS